MPQSPGDQQTKHICSSWEFPTKPHYSATRFLRPRFLRQHGWYDILTSVLPKPYLFNAFYHGYYDIFTTVSTTTRMIRHVLTVPNAFLPRFIRHFYSKRETWEKVCHFHKKKVHFHESSCLIICIKPVHINAQMCVACLEKYEVIM